MLIEAYFKILSESTPIEYINVIRTWRQFSEECARHRCSAIGVMDPAERGKCAKGCRMEAANKIVFILRQKLSECEKSENPARCKERIQKLINKFTTYSQRGEFFV